MNIRQWLASESDRDQVIALRPAYVDMAGDLAAGVLLSQIMYWHTPDRNGRSKLRVRQKDKETGEVQFWIAKAHRDWWDEVRLTEKQVRRALDLLEERTLIVTQVNRFNGSPTTHVRLNEGQFMAALEANLPISEPVLPSRADGNLPKGQMETDERDRTLTETTTEITSKTKEENVNAAISAKLPGSDSFLLEDPIVSPWGEVFDRALIPELEAIGVQGANLQLMASEEYALDTWSALDQLKEMLANRERDKRFTEIDNPAGWLYHMVVKGGLAEDRRWSGDEYEQERGVLPA